MNRIQHNDPDIVITFTNEKKDEYWDAGPDTRHGQRGYRVVRYVNNKWDNNYMFFTSLDEVYTACMTGRLHEGRQAF